MGDIFNNGAFMVFFIQVMAAIGLLVCYGLFSRFSNQATNERVGDPEFSQAQYMREVRLRYQGSMANANGYGRKWMQITQNGGAPTGGRNSEMSFV